MKESRRRLKTVQLETGASGRTPRQELPREGEMGEKSLLSLCGNDVEAVKAHSEETARTRSLGVVSLCRRNPGSFK